MVNIMQMIFSNTSFCINIVSCCLISMKYAPKGHINKKPALVKIMASNRRQATISANGGIVYWRLYAPLGVDELTKIIGPWGDLTAVSN